MVKELLIIPILFELIHWYAYIRHLDVPLKKKLLYTAVDFIHNAIVFITLFLLVTSVGNPKKVLLLNTIYVVYIIQFFIFKKCSLTLLHNRILGPDYEHNFVSHKDRLMYLMNGKYSLTNKSSMEEWMRWNIWQLVALVFLNTWTLLKT